MTVLLTGATGFLGSELARQLSGRGERVRVLVRPTSDLRRLSGLDLDVAEGDVTDRASVTRVLDGVAQVHHVAAMYELGASDPVRMREVNVGGTTNVLEAAAERGIPAVHVSSVSAQGPSPPDGRWPRRGCHSPSWCRSPSRPRAGSSSGPRSALRSRRSRRCGPT